MATARALAILVDFPDEPGTLGRAGFESLLFSEDDVSVRTYFLAQSRRLFDLEGDVVGGEAAGQNSVWLRLPYPLTYYANNQMGLVAPFPKGARGVTADAVALLSARGFDWSPYMSDGAVQYLFIVHAGMDATITGSSNDIWSHASSLDASAVGVLGANGAAGRVDRFLTIAEMGLDPGTYPGIGVIAHEFGHILGLPDLYDLLGLSQGVGPWSLMGTGMWLGPSRGDESGGLRPDGSHPAGLDPWSRQFLGWLQPVALAGNPPSLMVFPAVASSPGAVYKLYPGGVPGPEYFLVENREPLGQDTYLPAGGLLIWHVDETIMDPASPYFRINRVNVLAPPAPPGAPASPTSPDSPAPPAVTPTPMWVAPPHYGVAIVEADGANDLLKRAWSGGTAHPFAAAAGGTVSWNDSSLTPSRLWNGASAGIAIDGIGAAGLTMQATVSLRQTANATDAPPSAPPAAPLPTPLPTPSPFPASPERGQLTGTVRNTRGTPVPYAVVGVAPLQPASVASTATADHAGRYALDAAPGLAYRLYALASGRTGKTPIEDAPAAPGDVRTRDLILEDPAALVTGVIVDAASGDPVIGAAVHVSVTAAGTVVPATLDARVDAAGRFALPVAAGTYTLVASAPGYSSQIVEALDVAPSARAGVGALHLLKNGMPTATPVATATSNPAVPTPTATLTVDTLIGRVLLPDGTPASGLAVAAAPRGGNGATARTVTDAEGAYGLRAADGDYQLRARVPGHVPLDMPVAKVIDGAAQAVDTITVHPWDMALEGTVTDDAGVPVAGADVALLRWDYAPQNPAYQVVSEVVRTNLFGRFTLNGAAIDYNYLRIQRSGFEPLWVGNVTYAAGKHTATYILRPVPVGATSYGYVEVTATPRGS